MLGREPHRRDTWVDRYEQARSSLDLGSAPATVRPLAPVSYLPSACLLARVEALGDGFDESMRVAEDVDLVWRLAEAGWQVRYAPEATVRHDHRSAPGAWLRRKAFYGSGAALLAERHGPVVAPVVLAPWTAVLAGAVLAQRRWSLPVAAAACGSATVQVVRKLDGEVSWRTAAGLAGRGAAGTLRQVAGSLLRHHWPLAVVAATRSRRARRALVVAALAETALAYTETRPDLDPVTFLVARRLDDLAYGTGLWQGAWRARSARALLPVLRSWCR